MRRPLAIVVLLVILRTGCAQAQANEWTLNEWLIRFVRIRDAMYETVDQVYRSGMVPTRALAIQYIGLALTSHAAGLESREEFEARVETVCPGWRADPTQFGLWLAGPLVHFQSETIDFRYANEALATAYSQCKPASWPEWGYWL